MQSTTIHLPGSGQPSAMFAFDANLPISERLMNLEPLGTPLNNEQWLAPGPVARLNDNPFCTLTSPYYQLRTLVVEAPPSEIRQISQAAYRTLLADITNSTHPVLVRFWNYLPQINVGSGDNEVYRQFCWGRADAFEILDLPLPAATAIGSHDNQLRITVLSTIADTRVEHIENPRQLSAYKYPKEYGPRSPSFARATWLERDATGLLLLSGTSSIVDHNTLHGGNLTSQIAETKRNIDHLIKSLFNQIGVAGQDLQALAMRFYLRDPAVYELAKQTYMKQFPDYPLADFYIADICRSDLSMEIEGVFTLTQQP